MTYKIIGKSQHGTEEIDEFDTESEARTMLIEYQIAFKGAMSLSIQACTS